ncbi:MAG: hypothetical protein Q9183_004337 [Haloplaca sp. 2 TL-2023]
MDGVQAQSYLFGGLKPWLPPPWQTSDDRVRGGKSWSSLTSLPGNCALFEGYLDIETLGGAGFASQFQSARADDGESATASDPSWDLSRFDGIEVDVEAGDGKTYTLILKDELPESQRDDGRERAGVNWEAEFKASSSGANSEGAEASSLKVWLPWDSFKATYRGKDKKDAGELKTGEIRRIGFMMRSYFGTQHGDFKLKLRSLSARDKAPRTAETTKI